MTIRDLRVELRDMGAEIDRLQSQICPPEWTEPFVEPKPIAAIADDVEMIAASLKGWAARAREKR